MVVIWDIGDYPDDWPFLDMSEGDIDDMVEQLVKLKEWGKKEDKFRLGQYVNEHVEAALKSFMEESSMFALDEEGITFVIASGDSKTVSIEEVVGDFVCDVGCESGIPKGQAEVWASRFEAAAKSIRGKIEGGYK